MSSFPQMLDGMSPNLYPHGAVEMSGNKLMSHCQRLWRPAKARTQLQFCQWPLNPPPFSPRGAKNPTMKVITTWATTPGSHSSLPAPTAAFDTLIWLSGQIYAGGRTHVHASESQG